jgi:CelD/BcsL family acetyltransferase involved in cellulose biosynthesis
VETTLQFERSAAIKPAALDCRVIRSRDELEQMRGTWSQLAKHPAGDFDQFRMIMRSPEWAAYEPCVLAIYEDKECVSILAGLVHQTLFEVASGLRVFWRAQIRELVLNGYFVIGETNLQISEFAVQRLLDLMIPARIDLIVCRNVQWESPLRRLLQLLPPLLCRDYLAVRSDYWVMRLPGSLEEVFQHQLKKKRRYWARRVLRQFEKSFSGRFEYVRFISTTDVEAFFRDAELISRKTRQGNGFRGSVEEREWLTRLAKAGELRAITLYIDKEPVSYWMCVQRNRRLYLQATCYDPAFSRFEPGTLVLLQVIEDACREGLDYLDMGPGPYSLKRYSNAEFPVWNFMVFSPNYRGALLNIVRLLVRVPAELCKRGACKLGLDSPLRQLWSKKATPRRPGTIGETKT